MAVDEPPDENTCELGFGGGGGPLRVADYMEGVVLLPVEEGGMKAPLFDGGPYTEVFHLARVGRCADILHTVESWGWGLHATGEEIIDEAAYDPIGLGAESILLLDGVKS